MTLNEIAYFVAGRLSREEDIKFLNEIKFAVKYYRALFIRRDAERNNTSRHYMQSLITPLIEVDAADSCATEDGCTILRTEYKIPEPVRFKDSVPFNFVGTVAYKKTITYTEPANTAHLSYAKYGKGALYYTYVNGYVYIYNAHKLKRVLIDAAFVEPEKAVTLCVDSVNCVSDDEPFPCPADMVQNIIQALLSTELSINIPGDDKEVNIDDKNERNA
jgi:hypothetical protein